MPNRRNLVRGNGQAIKASQKMQEKQNQSPSSLFDLEDDLLEKILGNINIWNHRIIRATSKRLCNASDTCVMRAYKKALDVWTSFSADSEECAALKAIKRITDLYVNTGYRSVFCGCLLATLFSSSEESFSPHMAQAKNFLLHFYNMVDKTIGNPQRSQLLYNLNLVQFLKSFPNSKIICCNISPLNREITIELKGPWLAMLFPPDQYPTDRRKLRFQLLLILLEMHMVCTAGQIWKQVWQCPNQLYVFGNDRSNPTRLIFEFKIHGSENICSLFQSCLEEEFNRPWQWPQDPFSVNLSISCEKAKTFRCLEKQHMKLSSFPEPRKVTEK